MFANAAPVSEPVLSATPQHQITDCPSAILVECSVENGREVTLSWYRGSELLNEANSPENITLTLPLLVKPQDNTVYTCVATNPVNNQTALLSTQELCSQQTGKVYCCKRIKNQSAPVTLIKIVCSHFISLFFSSSL